MKGWYGSFLFVLIALVPASGENEPIDGEILQDVVLSVVSAGQIQRVQFQLEALESQMRQLLIVRNTLIQSAAERNSVNLFLYDYSIEDGKFLLTSEEPDEVDQNISP